MAGVNATQAQLEAAVRPIVERFERFYLGRSSGVLDVDLIGGALVVRSTGAATEAESRLLQADATPAARELVERLYRRMVRQAQESLIGAVESALGVSVRAVLCDLDAAASEAVLVLTFDGEPDVGSLRA